MSFHPPNPLQDVLSFTTSLIRESIQGRRQNQDILGRIPTPTYEELRKKELTMLERVSSGSGDWKINAFNNPEVNDPSQRTDRNLIIKDLTTFEEIKLQFVPLELDYKPESNFVAIASMGRNNPHYHFTGAEDTLNFMIDWHSYEEGRKDVIRNCKKLEALTKNDSYNGPPHKVKLIWNSILFSDAVWHVTAAPYKMSLFQAQDNMLPAQAYQQITLKKVSATNISFDDIRKIST